MRKDKERIFQLRREGRTYREIQRDTGVSRATLSLWFKDLPWSKHLSQGHREKNAGSSKDRMDRLNMVRKLKLQYQYALVESEAQKQYGLYRTEPLFWAGLMLYGGNGDIQSKHQVRVSSRELYVHKLFKRFAEKYLQIKPENVSFELLMHANLDEDTCREFWASELNLSEGRFYKTQVLKSASPEKGLRYGVGISIISNTSLKKKVLKWLSLAQEEQFDTAVMV